MKRLILGLVIGGALASLACSNDDATLVVGLLRPGGGEVSLARDVQPIFDATCALSGCHAGSPAESSLNLEPGRAFDPVVGIVGVPSLQLSDMPRVTPSDPPLSYPFHKIAGPPIVVGGFG